MKNSKVYSIITTLMLIASVMISSIVITPNIVLAAEYPENLENVSTQTARTTEYNPISGASSGSFYGLRCITPATFSLPKGKLTISYNYDASDHLGSMIFTCGSYSETVNLIGDGNNHTTTVTLTQKGIYTVSITSSLGGDRIQKYYGYSLYVR